VLVRVVLLEPGLVLVRVRVCLVPVAVLVLMLHALVPVLVLARSAAEQVLQGLEKPRHGATGIIRL
jgi:hypothetical protein